jgi:hypothetical protein
LSGYWIQIAPFRIRKDAKMAIEAIRPERAPGPPKEPALALVDRRQAYVQCAAERAECTCPDYCERDHDNE